MSHFYIDDQFPFHPKALKAGNAAIGLWARAGALSKQQTTGGHVPLEVARALGTKAEADRLVRAGLWIVVDDGYVFHDWESFPGNFSAEEEKRRRDAARESARQRKQKQRARTGHIPSHSEGHSVTAAGVTPESRAPHPHPYGTGLNDIGPVPADSGDTDGTDDEFTQRMKNLVAGLGVDFDRVDAELRKVCSRNPQPAHVVQVVSRILERAGRRVEKPTGFVVTSIRSDWAEWQQLIDTAA